MDQLAADGIGAARVVLPRSRHLPYLEVPEAFNRLVGEFLA